MMNYWKPYQNIRKTKKLIVVGGAQQHEAQIEKSKLYNLPRCKEGAWNWIIKIYLKYFQYWKLRIKKKIIS
jgi:hypothetical protein